MWVIFVVFLDVHYLLFADIHKEYDDHENGDCQKYQDRCLVFCQRWDEDTHKPHGEADKIVEPDRLPCCHTETNQPVWEMILIRTENGYSAFEPDIYYGKCVKNRQGEDKYRCYQGDIGDSWKPVVNTHYGNGSNYKTDKHTPGITHEDGRRTPVVRQKP